MDPNAKLALIDALILETKWLQSKYPSASPLFQGRINARLEAICTQLRELNDATDGHTVTCWFDVQVA